MLSVLTVHTTGINWQGVLTNVASITIIVGAMLAFVVRTVKGSIKEQIEAVIKTDVMPIRQEIETSLRDHDTRIARLEGVEEGKKQAVAQAGVSANIPGV